MRRDEVAVLRHSEADRYIGLRCAGNSELEFSRAAFGKRAVRSRHAHHRRAVVVGDAETDAPRICRSAVKPAAGIGVQIRQIERDCFAGAFIHAVGGGRQREGGDAGRRRGAARKSNSWRAAERGVTHSGRQGAGRGQRIVGAQRGGPAYRERQNQGFPRNQAAA